jgi:hypothetical protein
MMWFWIALQRALERNTLGLAPGLLRIQNADLAVQARVQVPRENARVYWPPAIRDREAACRHRQAEGDGLYASELYCGKI